MQKTVTLSTQYGHKNGGLQVASEWTSNHWTNYRSIKNTEGNLYIGHRSASQTEWSGSGEEEYNATYLMFNPTQLAKYKSKTIVSITLKVYVQSGSISTGTTYYRIGFKLNGDYSVNNTNPSSAWVRSNQTQTAASNYDVAYLRRDGVGGYAYVDVGKTVPNYGYVIGTINTTPIGNYVQLSGDAELTIVYEEAGNYLKVSGSWKDAETYIKVGGVWKPVTATYVKSGGEWKSS